MTRASSTSDNPNEAAPGAPDRQSVLELAWRPWELIGQGRVDEAMAILDDGGTWWDMAGRSEQPMSRVKTLLGEVMSVLPLTFKLTDSIVEGNRVALSIESFGEADDGTKYNNVYTFITDVDLSRNVIVALREYSDTLHAATVLIPVVSRVVQERGGDSALARVFQGS